VIRTLEGPIAPVECVSELNPDDCNRAEYCVTRKVWSRLRDSISEVLDSYTLEDLVKGSDAGESAPITISKQDNNDKR
jgi:DNA-binding IscR family transcriptional regulator